MAERLTRKDWTIINEALALYEVHLDDEEPDVYRADDPDDEDYERELAAYEDAVADAKATRRKVFQRLPFPE